MLWALLHARPYVKDRERGIPLLQRQVGYRQADAISADGDGSSEDNIQLTMTESSRG